jgi:PRTRC genetic system protein E
MFIKLFQLLEGGNIIDIRITKKEDKLTCMISPVINTTKEPIVPIIVSGTPEELETQFIDLISKPLKAASIQISDTNVFLKQLEKIKEKAKKDLEAESKKKPSSSGRTSSKPIPTQDSLGLKDDDDENNEVENKLQETVEEKEESEVPNLFDNL